jgi:hypothetical protein
MRTFKILTLVAIAILGFTSCSNDDDAPQLQAIEAEQFINLHAPQTSDFTTNPPTTTGDFVKFDFSTGTTTTSDTDWDIAFRGTTILVNGGSSSGIAEEPSRTGNAAAYIVTDVFNDVNAIAESSFEQDSSTGLAITTGSGNGWYNYDGSNPSAPKIEPIPGKVIIFRTADNKYAKVEILSYYKDNPEVITEEIAQNDSRYYTFNYVYQPNDNVTTFE